MSNEYKNASASLIKWVGDVVRSDPFYSAPGREMPKVVDFDAINDEAQLPGGDIYGLADYSIVNDDGLFVITARIGVSCTGDGNSFRQRDLVNMLFNAARPDAPVPIVDAESAAPLGQMKFMSGTNALPVVITAIRTYKYVAVSLGYSAPRQP